MDNSLRGQFLIACKPLRDPNFYRSVVLIVEHNHDGAMGLIVNRPSEISVQEALDKSFECSVQQASVGLGGPVESSHLFLLHSDPFLADYDSSVMPDVFITGSPESFQTVMNAVVQNAESLQFRVFLGCAGWGPGQLEEELARGDWHLHPADADAVFTSDPYTLWEDLMQRVGATCRIESARSAHPEWN